jgi:hypothetical protein
VANYPVTISHKAVYPGQHGLWYTEFECRPKPRQVSLKDQQSGTRPTDFLRLRVPGDPTIPQQVDQVQRRPCVMPTVRNGLNRWDSSRPLFLRIPSPKLQKEIIQKQGRNGCIGGLSAHVPRKPWDSLGRPAKRTSAPYVVIPFQRFFCIVPSPKSTGHFVYWNWLRSDPLH